MFIIGHIRGSILTFVFPAMGNTSCTTVFHASWLMIIPNDHEASVTVSSFCSLAFSKVKATKTPDQFDGSAWTLVVGT
jgi:hypothetical protein